MNSETTPSNKRLRLDEASTAHAPSNSTPEGALEPYEQQTLPSASNVEDLLSVPPFVIFQEVPSSTTSSTRRKPLLSRAEAQAFLNVALLAQEMDALASVSAVALEQKIQYRDFTNRIARADHPYLRPLLPLLYVYSETVPNTSLARIQVELNRVVAELRMEAESLRQFSGQNWNLSESLVDAAGSHPLAGLKRSLSDIQEELGNRIDGLLKTNATAPSEEPCSMEEYCRGVLNASPNDRAASQLSPPPPSGDVAKLPVQYSLSAASSPTLAMQEPQINNNRLNDAASQSQLSPPPPRPASLPVAQASLPRQPEEPAAPFAMATLATQANNNSSQSSSSKSIPREKENVSSQPSQDHSSQGIPFDPVYGSQGSVASESPCRLTSSALNAAEMLSILAHTPGNNGLTPK